MGWTLSDSAEEFRQQAGALLVADPATNTVLITVTDRLVSAGPTAFGSEPVLFGWWRDADGSTVRGAFLVTPPFPVRLSAMPDAAAAELARQLGPRAPSVAGARSTVGTFVEAWRASTRGTATVQLRQRRYRLDALAQPDVPGAGRRADAEDRDLLVIWFDAFAAELGGPHGDTEGAVDSRLVGGAMHLWEDGGKVVSMAGASAVLSGMARVGPVYTPPELRGHGYASAVTAAATADALARGAAQVVLYTDLANPTSNSIYQRLGYRPIGDEVIVDLTID